MVDHMEIYFWTEQHYWGVDWSLVKIVSSIKSSQMKLYQICETRGSMKHYENDWEILYTLLTCFFSFQFRNALMPGGSRSNVTKMHTTASRLRPSRARSSSHEDNPVNNDPGVSPQRAPGCSYLTVPNQVCAFYLSLCLNVWLNHSNILINRICFANSSLF